MFRSYCTLFRAKIHLIKPLFPDFLNNKCNKGQLVPYQIGHMMSSKSEDLVVQYFEAVEKCNIPKVEELLSSGAVKVDLGNTEFLDRTALHIAAYYGHYDLARILVDKYQAQVNIKDENKDIPLQVATNYHNIQIVKFLLQRNSDLREYPQCYLNTKEVDELFEAAESNNIEKIIQLITERGVHVDSEDRGNYNRTILEVAATKGYYDLVKILVDTYGADIQHEDQIDECAKHMAAFNGHENIVNFLLERGFKEPYTWLIE